MRNEICSLCLSFYRKQCVKQFSELLLMPCQLHHTKTFLLPPSPKYQLSSSKFKNRKLNSDSTEIAFGESEDSFEYQIALWTQLKGDANYFVFSIQVNLSIYPFLISYFLHSRLRLCIFSYLGPSHQICEQKEPQSETMRKEQILQL